MMKSMTGCNHTFFGAVMNSRRIASDASTCCLLIRIFNPTVIDRRQALDQGSLDRIQMLQSQSAFVKLTI